MSKQQKCLAKELGVSENKVYHAISALAAKRIVKVQYALRCLAHWCAYNVASTDNPLKLLGKTIKCDACGTEILVTTDMKFHTIYHF